MQNNGRQGVNLYPVAVDGTVGDNFTILNPGETVTDGYYRVGARDGAEVRVLDKGFITTRGGVLREVPNGRQVNIEGSALKAVSKR